MSNILIIEDDVNIAELEKDYLEISGYEVKIVSNGLEGIDEARRGQYDLIIIDVMLPGADGFQICKTLRGVLDIPMIMVSASGDDIDKIRGLGLGANDYITKPFSPNELVARVNSHIKNYLRLTKDVVEDVIESGELVIDKSKRVVEISGKEITLTIKEFDILELLARNKGKVFSKEDIFEKIWLVDSIGDMSTVTVHVRNLREKIEKDPTKPKYIETVWGVGYKFKG